MTADQGSYPTLHATQKGHLVWCPFIVAEKAGFEPALRSTHTTPLAGEPLEPLGYFSITQIKLLRI